MRAHRNTQCRTIIGITDGTTGLPKGIFGVLGPGMKEIVTALMDDAAMELRLKLGMGTGIAVGPAGATQTWSSASYTQTG